MKRVFHFYICSFCFLAVFCPAAHAQHWKNIGNLHENISCGYFWNTERGLVCCSTSWRDGYALTPGILSVYLTTNGGQNWSQSTLPANQNLPYGFGIITNISMHDTLTGWLSVASPYQSPVIWITSDGGRSWDTTATVFISLPEGYSNVTQTHNGTYLISNADGIALEPDSIRGIRDWVTNSSFYLQYTPDNGGTWDSIAFPGTVDYNHSIEGDLTYSAYFKSFMSYLDNQGSTDSVYISYDEGKTWQSKSIIPLPVITIGTNSGTFYQAKTTGDMESAYRYVYLQGRSTGMLRSSDDGSTWKLIGGPFNWIATRFCLIPTCSGGSVVAFDTGGSVWITTDGGDGTLTEPATILPTLKTTATVCRASRIPIIIQSSSCQWLSIDSVMLSDDSTNSFTLEGQDTLLVGSGNIDTIWVDFNPEHSLTTHTVKVEIRGRIDAGGALEPFDSLFTLTGIVTTLPPQLSAVPNLINLSALNTCFAIDTTIAIRNTGCDTLTLDSLTGTIASGLSLFGIAFPVRIPPDSSSTLTIRYQPPAPGLLNEDFTLHASQQGLTATVEILLSGTAVAGEGALSISPVATTFPEQSICSADSTSFAFRNLGCDTLAVTSISLGGDPDFQTSGGRIENLPPGDSTIVRIYFTPESKGIRTASYTIRSHSIKDPSKEQDTTITFSADVIDGSRLFSIDTATQDLHTGSLCRVADTVLVLTNTGCDTLHVKRVAISGSGYTLLTPPASSIPPGTSDTLVVQFTASSVGTATAVLTLQTDANQDSTVVIGFTAQSIAPQSVRFLSGMSRTNILENDTTTVFVYPSGAIANVGLNAIAFTLNYNGDLLTETGAVTAIPNATMAPVSAQQTGSAATLAISIAGNNLTLDPRQPIAAVHFRSTLTDSIETPITVSNIALNAGDPTYSSCTLSAADSGTAFSLQLLCGDTTLIDAMENKFAFTIKSIAPNPASGSVSILLSDGGVHYEVVDLFGRTLQNGTLNQRVNVLDVRSLVSGSFFFRFSTSNEVVTKRFIIQR